MAGNDGGDQVKVTPDDVGPVIAIVTWFFMIMMILSVLFRIIIKLYVRRRMYLDDYMVCGSLVFGVAQSILISLSISNGLGKRKASLDAEQLIRIEKELYAGDLLFVLACSWSKISLLLLIQQLAVSKVQQVITKGSIYLVAAWMISSFLALAFRCDLPSPWDIERGRCFNEFLFWVIVGFFDIVTEVAVMVLPIFMLLPVQIAFSKKVTVIACFLFRLSVTLAIAVRVYLIHSQQSSSDFVFDSEATVIATQILVSVAITTACVPSLKPFLDSFESGALRVDLSRSGGDGTNNSYQLSNMKRSGLRSNTRDADVVVSGNRPDKTGYLVDISGHRSRRGRNHESDSFESENSDAMIIKRTDEWTVQYDHDEAMRPTTSSGSRGEN